jgi:hypothetical protein
VNTLKAHLYDQFRRPRIPLGLLAGGIMSKRSSNVERSAWTVETLKVQPGWTDRYHPPAPPQQRWQDRHR